jgi:hypothetical protein
MEAGMEDMLRDLELLSHRGERFRQLFADLGQAAPGHSQGSDRSGAVMVVLGPEGLPDAIRVHPNWRERLPVGALAAAVAEASALALQHRQAQWAQALDKSGWQQRLDGLDHPGGTHPGPGSSYRAAPRRPIGRVRCQSLGDPAEDAIRRLDAVLSMGASARQAPPGGTGVNDEGTVAISLTPGGQMSCQADARWVERQSPMALERALNAALASARQSLAGA